VTSIEGVVSEHYRRTVSEKTRDALHRLRAQGRRVSRFPPYGFQHDGSGGLVPQPNEQAALGEIGALSSTGLSLRALAARVSRAGRDR
jgi:DNA invertase Pin-like site-specific DNA recombinase